MDKITINLPEDTGNFLLGMAHIKKVEPSAMIDETIRSQMVLEEFGSEKNFDKFIQDGIDSGLIEMDDKFWFNFRSQITKNQKLHSAI